MNVAYASFKENDEYAYLIREEFSLNFEAGFTAGLITLGVEFLFIGFTQKKKVE